ncbi:DUF349 domain-containing protein [Bermanella sp. R86510]|uniref:DUF349 domain-containing protein n=1 Tax=unclassified Bermanella TaxID=2627862 RepID=UPI0037C904A4
MAGFLKQLFSAKWQHKDPDVRLQAMSETLDNSILLQLAQSDPDIRVQKKATSQLSNIEDLQRLINSTSNAELLKVAFNTLISLVNQQYPVLSNAPQPLLSLLAGQAFDTELATEALTSIDNTDALVTFIQTTPSAKARHLAVEKIDDIGTLKQLEKQFKAKDKTLVRLAKEKITQYEQVLADKAEQQAHINHIIDMAKQLSTQAFDPLFAGKLTHAKQQWQAVEQHANAEQTQQFKQTIDQCDNILAANQEEQAAIEARSHEQAQLEALCQQALADGQQLFAAAKNGQLTNTDALSTTVKLLSDALVDAKKHNLNSWVSDLEDVYKPLLNLEQSLLQVEAIKPIELDVAQASVKQLKQAQKTTNKNLQSINWPQAFADHKIVSDLHKKREAIQHAITERKAQEVETLKAIDVLLSKMEQALEDGQAKQADHLQKQLKKKLANVDQVSNAVQSRFSALQQRLFELNDWKGFAAAPKLETLCERMQALADNPLEGAQQVEQVQLLQEEWKSVSKASTQVQQNHYWPLFKQAKDSAFEVCKAFYAEQAQQRDFNKQQRELICQQLELYVEENDWQTCNYKKVIDLVSKAKQEYKKFAPVEKEIHKPLQARFYNAVKAIESKVDTHYQEVANNKQALIESVIALQQADDIATAIEECKALQQDWKQLGNAGRKENTLWKQFRQACDAVFERRQQEQDAHKQATQANIAQANALVDALTEEVQQGRSDIAGVKQIKLDIQNLDLPHKVRYAIEQKLEKLIDVVKQTQQQEKQLQLFDQWQSIAAVSQEVAKGNIDTAQKGINEVRASGALNQLVKQLEAAIKQPELAKAKEDEFQLLCLYLDIALGHESPAEEQQMRMAAQVKRLQESIGQGPVSRQEQILDLAKQWLSLVPENENPYHDRFWQALLNEVNPQTEHA